jgi:hypothetical protein
MHIGILEVDQQEKKFAFSDHLNTISIEQKVINLHILLHHFKKLKNWYGTYLLFIIYHTSMFI